MRFSFKKSHLDISLTQPEFEVFLQREDGSVHVRHNSGFWCGFPLSNLTLLFLWPIQSVRFFSGGKKEVPIPPQLRLLIRFLKNLTLKRKSLIFLCPSQRVRSSFRGKKEVPIPPRIRFFIRFPFKKSHLKEKVLDVSLSQPECKVLFQREEGSVHYATTQMFDKVSL